jgi:hypothetical protein
MLMPTDDLIGRHLCDSGSQPVGTITAAYRYPPEMSAPWGVVAVSYGLILRTHLVDLEQAVIEGEVVWVPHTRHVITTAPNYRPRDGETLTDHHAAKVREHYWGAAQPV